MRKKGKNNQLDLFGEKLPQRKPIKVIARTEDPDTSHEAANDLEKDQPKLQRSVTAIARLLASYGPMTDFAIASHWAEVWPEKYSESLPRKARHWAREAGLVCRDGYGSHNGRRVIMWGLGKDESFLEERQQREE
jgi:hypothetical protein